MAFPITFVNQIKSDTIYHNITNFFIEMGRYSGLILSDSESFFDLK